jgi:glycosyltransferase involved in cell wall biosynthesis
MRVLHVTTGLATGGAEAMLTKVVSHGTTLTHHVVSLTAGGENKGRILDAGVPVTELGMFGAKCSPIALRRLVRVIREWRPDVVQGWMYHGDLFATLGLALAGRRGRTVLCWGIRCSNMDFSQYSRQTRMVVWACARLSRVPDAIIANSEAGRRVHRDLGYYDGSLELVPNGFDTDVFKPDAERGAAMRRVLNIAEDARVFALIARVDPMKDHGLFLEALARTPGAVGLVAGKGTDHLPAGERLVRLGARNDVSDLLTAADVLVSSSAYGEGFSNSIAEGMSAGLVPLVTDVGDSAAIVGDSGIVVPPRDLAAMTRAMGDLVAMAPETLRERKAKARERVVDCYTIDRAIEKFEAIYRGTVRGRALAG